MSSKPRGMEGESLYDRRLVRSAVGGPKKPPAQHGLNRPAAKTARDHQVQPRMRSALTGPQPQPLTSALSLPPAPLRAPTRGLDGVRRVGLDHLQRAHV